MTTQELILIILGIAFLMLSGFAVPVLLELLRTARSMTRTLELLNERLPGILKNLEEATEGINRTTAVVQRQVEGFSATVQKVQGTINVLVGFEELLRRSVHLPFARKMGTALAVVRGVRVFMDHLFHDPSGRNG